MLETTTETANSPTESNWRNLLSLAQANNPAPHARFAQLATLQGGAEPRPAVRTVVVRGFLDDGRMLISTDMRSEKVAELAAHSACELCWYFADTREQFRLNGRGHIVAAPTARLDARLDLPMQATWAERSNQARQSYTWPQPGRRRDADGLYALKEPSEIPAHFALLLIEVVTVDYLNIAASPHERTLFNKLGGQWRARAVNP